MGLDQVWITQEKDSSEEQVLFQHRKVPALEEFMAEKWVALNPGKRLKEFNCEKLPITLDLLNELREVIRDNMLNPDATGFFWGYHVPGEHDAEILEALEEAETAIVDRDATVYYTSWW